MLKYFAAITLTLAAQTSAAAEPTNSHELQKCQGRDTFTYWTPSQCAPGDKPVAYSTENPQLPLALQIRRAECKLEALKRLPYVRTRPGMAYPAPSTDHCN